MKKTPIKLEERVNILRKLRLQLSKTELKVLSLRYDLYCKKPKSPVPLTLEEVGKKLGVGRERVRQIEAKAMAKLNEQEIIDKKRQEILSGEEYEGFVQVGPNMYVRKNS